MSIKQANVMVIDIWSFLLLAGLVQGAFLFWVLLFHRKGNRKANRFLAALVGVITAQLFTYLLISTGLYRQLPHLINAGIPLMFLIGPLYYYYAKSLLNPDLRLSYKDLLHALPVLVGVLYYLPYYLDPAADKIAMVEYLESIDVVEIPNRTMAFIGFLNLQTGTYIWMALALIRGKSDSPKRGSLKGSWLEQFSYIFLGYWVFTFLCLLLLDFFDSFAPEIDYLIFFSMSMIIHVVGYKAITESGVFSGRIPGMAAPKYESSPLSREETREMVKQLQELMDREELYLDSELSLQGLAEKLSVSSNYLSQAINQELGCNFYDFVNRYRIKEAKKRLNSPAYKNLTILAIAYEVGFNNKNSFNKAFKKFTGTTPSGFIKQKKPHSA